MILGTQWGDEGKGKIIDLLSAEAGHVVRGQGGNNAGHTIITKGHELKLHLIPSGILHPHVNCYLGAGMVIDPEVLIGEMEDLNEMGVALSGRLFLSPGAHVIFPFHKELDRLISKDKIGTTGRGIGPCYSDRASRIGIRLGDLLLPSFKDKLFTLLNFKEERLKKFEGYHAVEGEKIYTSYLDFAKKLAPFIKDFEQELAQKEKNGERVLVEGAQGFLLDIAWGTYPFVTSSSTVSSGVLSGCGFPPNRVSQIIGVTKAYCTRVGEGPFPTEITEEELFLNHQKHREFGTTTGRRRRIGFLDLPLLKYACDLSGVTALALTKLDIFDEVKTLKVCTHYEKEGKPFFSSPMLAENLQGIQPVYKEFKGWGCPTSEISSYEDLPEAAKTYVEFIESHLEIPIEIISVGPDRNQTIFHNLAHKKVGV